MGRGRSMWSKCCWVCGDNYVLNNFMRRKGNYTADGRFLPDTHHIACYKKFKQANPDKEPSQDRYPVQQGLTYGRRS